MTRWSLFLQTLSLLHHFLGLYWEGTTTILPSGRARSRESACLQCAFTPLAGARRRQRRTRNMVHGKNRIPYWIDRRLTGLAGSHDDATISLGLPIEPEDSQYGKYRLREADDLPGGRPLLRPIAPTPVLVSSPPVYETNSKELEYWTIRRVHRLVQKVGRSLVREYEKESRATSRARRWRDSSSWCPLSSLWLCWWSS